MTRGQDGVPPGMAMDEAGIASGIRLQAEHCRRNDAPITARIVEAGIAIMRSETLCGARIRGWPGLPLEDAMPLRFAAGFHHLHLSGDDDRLAQVYGGSKVDQAEVDAIVLAVLADHDARLLRWFDGPPQTNEAGRSASFMAGLLWLSSRAGPRFEINELGASAGVNTMMERYRYDLGGVMAGPVSSPMHIAPEWRGPQPPRAPVEIVAIRGCDTAPADLSVPAAALRIKSYVWPDAPQRLQRIDAAIALAAEQRPDLVRADAADWVEERLAAPHPGGVTRVFNHSIVWQYVGEDRRARITAAIEAAGRMATPDRPIAWMMLETNRATFRHELTIRHWPGDGVPHVLGQAQAHGAWVEWYGG